MGTLKSQLVALVVALEFGCGAPPAPAVAPTPTPPMPTPSGSAPAAAASSEAASTAPTPSASPPSAAAASASTAPKGCEGEAPTAVDADAEGQVLDLVNAERQQRQLPTLRLSPALADAARLHARQMSEVGYLEHDSFERSENGLIRTCEWVERLRRFAPGRNHLAENIASGASTPREVVEGWMNSPVHRANVLGAAFRELGVGYWAGGDSGFYWVADFAGD